MGIKLSDKDFEIMCKIMIKEYKQKEYHSSIRVRIHGVLEAALIAIDKKMELRKRDFLSEYRACVRKLFEIIEILGSEEQDVVLQAEDLLRAVLEDDYECKEELIETLTQLCEYCYSRVVATLSSMKGESERYRVVTACLQFRESFADLEKCIKDAYCKEYPFFIAPERESIPDFEQGVLVRSVQSLEGWYGFHGTRYPTISTNIFKNSNPVFYNVNNRKVLLIYTVSNSEDILAMFGSDGVTGFVTGEATASLAYFVEKLMFRDGSSSETIGTLQVHYRCAYPMEELIHDEFCEILLRSEVPPIGILVMDENWLKNSEHCRQIVNFAGYYSLPVYLYRNGKTEKIDYENTVHFCI